MNYIVKVRLELVNDDTGRVVTYDTHEYAWEPAGPNPDRRPYDVIEDAVLTAISQLENEEEE